MTLNDDTRSPAKRGALISGLALLWLLAQPVSVGAATNIFSVVNSGVSAYLINGASNPNLKLVRGFTYTFNISAPFHPFWIKSVQGNGTANAFTDGVTGNGTDAGTVVFAVPTNAPSLLFYNCEVHPAMTGQLNIEDPPVVSIITFTVDTNLTFESTGTDALNVRVAVSSSLVTGGWSNVPSFLNSYSQGTNTTTLTPPADPIVFFRIQQTLP